jgi:putative heme-binding domain-containing protein
LDGLPILQAMLDNAANVKDPLIPSIIYANLRPLILSRGSQVVDLLDNDPAAQRNFGQTVVQWVREATNALVRTPEQIAASVRKHLEVQPAGRGARQSIAATLQDAIDGFSAMGVATAERTKLFDAGTRKQIEQLVKQPGPARAPAIIMALWWNDPQAAAAARQIIADAKYPAYVRVEMLRGLADRKDAGNVAAFAAFVSDAQAPVLLRQQAVDALGAMDDAKAAGLLLDAYPRVEPVDLKPMIVNALVRTKGGASAVLDALRSKQLAMSDINENQARSILDLNDPNLSKRVSAEWGTVRTERDPERARLVDQYKKMILSHAPGDPIAGMKVFAGTCMQCHTLYGKGGSVGPDLTGVGRDNLDLVLSNVLDPNLVVGKPYYQWSVRLKNGTTASGLLVEESEKRIVLKDSNQQLTVPRDQIDRLKETTLSMMPERLEKTMSQQQFVDLIAFLLTKQPPATWTEAAPPTR